jgi:glycosyltransferase involved in cell wall biosynthesis
MMRVAIVIDSLRVGGAQKLVASFVRAAAAHGIEATVICLRNDHHPIVMESMKAKDVRIVEFSSSSLIDLARLIRLTRFLRAEKFDLIHTHLSYANILGCLAGYSASIPVIASLHNTAVDGRHRSGLIVLLEEAILRYFAHRIIAVGYGVADVFRARLQPRPVDVIPNGIPFPDPITPEARQKLRREIAGHEDRVLVLAVGRVVQAKGYDDMVEAFALLHQRTPSPFLAIAGSGRLFDAIKRRISEMHLDDSISCLGVRNDIPRLLAASDIFVSSSHWEGLPVALLEAMMAGLPIVATAVGDVPKVVTPEAGIIVAPHEPACLADALNELVNTPERARAMGNAARARAMQEYSLETWMKRHVAVYEEALRPVKV